MNADSFVDERLHAAAERISQMPSVSDAVMRQVASRAITWDPRPRHRVRPRVTAVAVAAVVLAAAWLVLPGGEAHQSAWWLAPAPAVAQEVRAAFDAAIAGSISLREELAFVRPGAMGTPLTGHDESRFYISPVGAYRRDLYSKGVLRESQWYVPEGDWLVQTSVRFDSRTVHVCRHPRDSQGVNLVERIRGLSDYLAQAEQRLGTRRIDGVECVGFVIDNQTVDKSADPGKATVWYDVATKLPVRVELDANASELTNHRLVWRGFNWHPDLPANTFVPEVPPDFEHVENP